MILTFLEGMEGFPEAETTRYIEGYEVQPRGELDDGVDEELVVKTGYKQVAVAVDDFFLGAQCGVGECVSEELAHAGMVDGVADFTLLAQFSSMGSSYE